MSVNDKQESMSKPKAKKITKKIAKNPAKETADDTHKPDYDSFLYIARPFVGTKDGYILVIVESPGKIKKLESILGNGYVVTSSFGHIIDLYPKNLSVDIENNFEPNYCILRGEEKFKDKTKVVTELRSKASKASEVILASDKDREGEFIAWSYMVALNLKDPKRITFNSITKKDIQDAIKNPSKINMLMVNSQKTRRIEDRLVGFKISPLLSQMMGTFNLSAGRVQSIVVRLICEKENEVDEFFSSEKAAFFKCSGKFKYDQAVVLKGELNRVGAVNNESPPEDSDEDNQNSAKKILVHKVEDAKELMDLISVSTFKVGEVTHRRSKRYPPAPYTTSTVQQDASTKLGFNVKRTMNALQKLYEAGLTTYLRTDSTALSSDATEQCKKYINQAFDKEHYNRKDYVNKKGNTQEAHEAIRPSNISKQTIEQGGKIGADEKRVYDLVWKRTVASQMSPAEVDVYTISILISKTKKYIFVAAVENVVFDGFLAIYKTDEHEPFVCPKKGQPVDPLEVKCSQEYEKPPLRYSEAGLIKKMDPKNLNIGRPATYAEIINTVQKRGYVEIKDIDGKTAESIVLSCFPEKDVSIETKKINIGKEHKKFVPTQLGLEVTKLLLKHVSEIMDYEFTSHMENQLDSIAEGHVVWTDVLHEFWKKLSPSLEKMQKEKKVQRVVGVHPETEREIVASIGRYGPMLSTTKGDTKKKTTISVSIQAPYNYETITLEDALKLLAYPKILGEYNNTNVELKKGRYGFYVTCGTDGANIPEENDPEEVTLEQAIDLIEKKKEYGKSKIEKYLYYKKVGDLEYIVNNGKYENNKYLMIRNVTAKKTKPTFVTFPKDEELENITFERIKEIAETKKEKKFTKFKKVVKKKNI